MKALAFPVGLVLTASLLAAPTSPAQAQTTAVPTPSGEGYWLVATDGGIFAYGDAGFFGSLGDRVLNKPITGMVPTPTGQGYWLVASDGGIFAFGDADFHGSAGGIDLNKPIVGMANSGDEAGFSAAGARGAAGPAGPPGSAGPPGPPGLAGRDATYVGADWSTVDRNVIGNGDSDLRAGPGSGLEGALGLGSLGIRTGSGSDKAAFGNTTAFAGDPVNGLTAISYSVFTTGENNAKAPNNMPSITFEIDPNIALKPATNYTSLVYVPDNSAPSAWTAIDAMGDPERHWGFSSGAFTNTECNMNGSRCTWAEILDVLDDNDGSDAVITFSAQITKGRDYAFSGAVDGFRINDTTFDFEPFGVTARLS